MLRPACVLLLLVMVLPALGCDDDLRSPSGEDDEVFTLPVGAEVTVSVGECINAPPVRLCTDWDLESLTRASLSGDDFELGEQRVEAGAALIRVRAKAPGRGTLTVEYVDERGQAQSVEVRLQALEVTRTELGLPCADRFSQRPRPVAAGSRFEFDIYANAGDTGLTTGDLSLVEAPGFMLTEPVDGKGVAIAPTEPGMYAWTLAGGGSAQFLVFTPDALDLTLTEEAARGTQPRAIILGAAVGGTPVCVHAPDDRAVVTVTGEGCAPLLSGVEIAGPMPVRLGSGAFKFELVGAGSCDVDARRVGGRGVTRPFTGAVPDGGVPPVIGPVVSEEGVELSLPVPAGGACPGSVSDGRCEAPWYLDGDCYIDSDWRIQHRDPAATDGGVVAEEAPVGVGLTTRLLLSLQLGLNPTPIPISLGPPQHLTYEQDPAWDWSVFPPRRSAGLGLENRGCVGSEVLMTVTPLAEGTHGLAFRADNLDDTGELDVEARRVDRVVYTLRPDGGPSRTGSPVELFVRSEATLTARYQRQNGTPLHGSGPLRIETDDPGALSSVRDPDALATGRGPHTLTVSSPLAPNTLTIKVRDASAILGIGAFKAEAVVQGQSACAEAAVPLGEGGVAILGRPPARPRVSLGGDALVFSPRAFKDGLCLEGVAPGEATLRLTWGSAQAERVWRVTPRP
ncbi:hypothetical protein [Archangium sp.]|jgi:hypothetical protein|uniref:hypothetical protein n=1 Tax=Archangium sp. TaxID=1872627 RepID=UPI002EDA3E1C